MKNQKKKTFHIKKIVANFHCVISDLAYLEKKKCFARVLQNSILTLAFTPFHTQIPNFIYTNNTAHTRKKIKRKKKRQQKCQMETK